MGHIWDDHGNIGIESRSYSFIIHPNYGYTYQLDALKEVKVGDWFYFQKEGQPDVHGVTGDYAPDGWYPYEVEAGTRT